MAFEISIFFPIFNNEKTIQNLVYDTIKTVNLITDDYEVILVNDGSNDNSKKICDELSNHNNKVKVVHHDSNKDYGSALKSGFTHSSKNIIFYTDADGQYNIEDLNKLLPLITKNDVVVGYKIKRNDPFYRIIIGNIYRFIVNRLFHLTVKDVTCDFRLFKKEVINSIDLKSNSGFICVELMKKIRDKGYKIAEVGVNHYPRQFGQSEAFKINKIFCMLKDFFYIFTSQYERT